MTKKKAYKRDYGRNFFLLFGISTFQQIIFQGEKYKIYSMSVAACDNFIETTNWSYSGDHFENLCDKIIFGEI